MMRYLGILLSVFIFTSCIESSGTIGPQGPEGPPGPIGQAFEVEADFTENNGYTQIFEIPPSVEIYSSDIVAVYLLWEVDESTGNDVWQQLPVSVFFNDGQLQYAFDHTVADVKLFLTGDTDLSTVGDGYTLDQIFRVVVLPAEYVQENGVDMSNMEEVMGAVKKGDIQRITL
ncbi:hypothetical protein G3570_12310 [Balneolaceae bacterium YR4-1]|uniref:Collagen-like protein n=2 Tax=Halalkalibaculum roseum TaxID=2709311 RepID=A0A6M1SWT8_9BACT|nr:hypothetical protein [Halalkalibaculum roseum]